MMNPTQNYGPMTTLNDVQQAAVSAPDRHVLVLAGAGSGKTRVIIERMAYLVEECGVASRQLLALTFTNKAAGEMRNRLAQHLHTESIPSFVGTFHSFSLWVLRRDLSLLGRPRDFVIYDDTDQLSLMKRLVKDLPKRFMAVSPRDALAFISRIKQIEPFPAWEDPPNTPEEESHRELWVRYHEALTSSKALDFDDLTALTAFLFDRFPDVRERYARRFTHVLIDEYQDTNRSQYVIARSLGEPGNLFVVGDEDQSIYSWRGADISNILNFTKDFPGARAFRLEENYRSSQAILDAANAVVAHNVIRLGKRLFTRRKGGFPVRHFFAEDAQEEAAFVVGDMLRRGVPPGSTAVFYRNHTLARLMEESLRDKRVPYVVVGGIKFYSRKEIKDLLAYLRLAVNPEDEESLRRILNVPPRGIGASGRAQLEEYAHLRHIPLFQALRESEMDDTLSARARNGAAALLDVIDTLRAQAGSVPVAEQVEQLIDRIGYRNYIEQSDERELRNRIEVVEEFVVACKQYDERDATGLAGFLEELALVSDVDGWEDTGEAATLMTCHCAKGLEFDHVYIIGLEEDMFPAHRYDSDDDIEEERRLCYVAMTRARESLTLTTAGYRLIYGAPNSGRRPSRFISEIGPERLEVVEYSGGSMGEAVHDRTPRRKAAPRKDAQVDGTLKTGDTVRHARFGRGVVLYTKGVGAKLQARIRFDSGRTALLRVAAAPMEKIQR